MTNAALKYDYEFDISLDMYNPCYLPYLKNPKNTEIFYGGSSSGKSNFVAARAIEDVMAGGHNYLCCRKMGNSLTKSVFNELEKAINKLKARNLFNIVPSAGHITCVNGYQILFSGLDDVEKVKSITPKVGVITDVWVEESTEVSWADIKQLRKRLRGQAIYDGKRIRKRIIMSFNPIFKTHWIVKEFFTPIGWTDEQTQFENDKIRILKTTHIDNDFLDPEDHEELENETDPYWKDVYTLGNWGSLGDSILKNWRVEDLSKRHGEFINIRHGVDFGYSSDPAAYVKIHYDPKYKKIYVFKGFHQTQLTNPDLAVKLKPYTGSDAVFCEYAEPKSIKELQDNGINAKPCGPKHVLFSIQWLQQHEIIIDSELQGMVNELTIWDWKKDKYGDSMPIPSDKNNHYIDAMRYALEIEYRGMKGLGWK